jgi:hypothetical protein
LEPKKTIWYSIDFNWKMGEWDYCQIEDNPGSMAVRDPTGEIVTIERAEVHDARCTLGALLAPDGNNEAQYKNLIEQAELWAERVRVGHLDR